MKIIILLLFSCVSLLPAQNLDFYIGTWEGESKQSPGGLRALYSYKLVFTHQKGEDLYGMAYVAFADDSSKRGEIAMVATQTTEGLLVKYKKVTLNTASGTWCLKTMRLELSKTKNQFVLKGPWTAPGCSGGSSEVHRRFEMPFKEETKEEIVTEELPKQTSEEDPKEAPRSENRRMELVEKIHVQKNEVIIQVWDANQEDGDILSLKLNNEWILENYALKNKKKELRIALPKGESLLLLYAENLGEIPPNTAAISINDGKRVRKLTLSSDQMKSEAIKIMVVL